MVSAIVPVYNTGKAAKKIVGKLLSSYDDLEVILINDGSTDDSADVLAGLKDERVSIYTKENGGPSSARNYGIDKARGKFLLFVDSDDEVRKDYIEKMVKTMDECVDLGVCGVEYHKMDEHSAEDVYLDACEYEKNESNKDLMLRSLLHDGRMYPVFNKIFRTEIIKKRNIRFDEAMSFGEDTKFVMEYLGAAKGKIEFVLEPLYVYHAGNETSVARRMQKEWKNWQTCYNNLKKWVGEKPTLKQWTIVRLIYLKWRMSWLKSII